MNDDAREPRAPEREPWPQRLMDNLWLLIALAVLIPGLLYLAWGLLELALLPEFGGNH